MTESPENLHSVRFIPVERFQGFLSFIMDMNTLSLGGAGRINLEIRSHPAKRLLQTMKDVGEYTFFDGDLTPGRMARFSAFCSPPSTIILDAVLMGLCAYVWTDEGSIGDTKNYTGLAQVNNAREFLRELENHDRSGERIFENILWAAINTYAFNGVGNCWETMRQIAEG